MKRYKRNSNQLLPCYECKHNTFEGVNCIGCINDKGTLFSKWEKCKEDNFK